MLLVFGLSVNWQWLQLTENRYGFISYRQDLNGFGEPVEGMWDGFQRINTDTKDGGIVGVFRHGAVETKRLLTVNYLNPVKKYLVKKMNGKIVAIKTGKELKEVGVEVVLDKFYDGELFEIHLQ